MLSLLLAASWVTTEVQGQLANQLFQTSVAIAFARDHGCEARFPSLKTAINGKLNLRYVFHRLDVSPIPDGIEFVAISEPTPDRYFELPEYEEGKNYRFQGYFPYVKYFARHSDYIQDLFSPTEEMIERIYEKYENLLLQETVAIHVRTFLPDAIDPNNGIGRENWDYFLNAIASFPDHVAFLVFSDRPDFVKEHFPRARRNLHFIEGNPHYFDFYFMSLCNHNILGPKSTYSWWAAWLNKNPDKIVIRPDDGWLPDEAYPDEWQKVSIR